MDTNVRHIGGVAVHVSGTGPGVVLLHANAGDHRDYAKLGAWLAHSRTVYAVDWPGHGDSGPCPDATACGFAELLPGLLDGIGAGPYALVGNSVGGFAALRTAITRPDLVSHLVLVDPGGFTPRTPVMRAACRLLGSERVAPSAMRQLPKAYLRRSTAEVRAARERAAEASRSPERVATFASLWRSFADPEHDARRDVESLAVPTLLVWGMRDPVLPWLVDGCRAARSLPSATVMTFPCGHQPYLEMPLEFAAAVSDFLGEPGERT